jgi:multisubunit Na+/H+ antiporter MnhB subunit
MSRRIRIRFGLATLLGAAGGVLIGAGVILIRVGYSLEELGWIPRIFAPSGNPAMLQGATLITVGLVVVLLSAFKPRQPRRKKRP